MRRGISEKRLYAYNPLPACVTEDELCKRAGLLVRADENRCFFDVMWRDGSGVNKEWIHLEAGGEPVELRESEARWLMRKHRDQGVVLLETAPHEEGHREELLSKSREGLRTAINFYNERGERALNKLMMGAGITREQLESFKGAEWAKFRNAEAAKEVEKELQRVQTELAGLRKTQAA